MLQRALLVAVSLVVLGWLAVLMRDHLIVEEISPRLVAASETEFERDAERLEDAALVNPDPSWRLNLALALVARDPRRAAAEAEQVLSGEPDNITAWRILEEATKRFDPPRSGRARARIRELAGGRDL
jgi:hypothetical protein